MKKKIFMGFLLLLFTQANAIRIGSMRCVRPMVQLFKRGFCVSIKNKGISKWQKFTIKELREIEKDAHELGLKGIRQKAAQELRKKEVLQGDIVKLLDGLYAQFGCYSKVVQWLERIK